MNRRKYLTLTSSGIALGLSGCIHTDTKSENQDGDRESKSKHVLEVGLYQTETLTNITARKKDNDHFIAEIGKNLIERTFQPLISISDVDGIEVNIIRDSKSMDTRDENINMRGAEFDEWMEHYEDRSKHANILLDVGPSDPDGTVGLANIYEEFSQECSSQSNNSAIVQHCNRCLDIPREKLLEKEIRVSVGGEKIDGYFPRAIIQSIPHEVGHLLCVEHGHGNSWWGDTVPDYLGINTDEETVYATIMLGFYATMDKYEYESNNCGSDLGQTNRDLSGYDDDFSVINEFSSCALSRMVESISDY